MGKTIEKAIWLSFDLGVGGDYPGLYKWLDNHDAIECGDSVAFFRYILDSEKEIDLLETVKKDISKTVNLRSGDRMYVIRREKTESGCAVKGDFIFGRRKARPWEGYGDADSSSSESGE